MLRRSWMRSQSVVARSSTSTSPEVGNKQAVQHLQRGGFSGAAAAQQHQRFAGLDAQAQVVQDQIAADAVGDVGEIPGLRGGASAGAAINEPSRDFPRTASPDRSTALRRGNPACSAIASSSARWNLCDDSVQMVSPAWKATVRSASAIDDGLIHARAQVHFDAALLFVPARLMLEVRAARNRRPVRD